MNIDLNKFNLSLAFSDYLNLNALSYSKLKSVKDKGHRFLLEKKEEEDNLTKLFKARDLGSVTDDLLLGDSNIEDSYIISTTEAPTASALKLANSLVEYCYHHELSFNDFNNLNKDNTLLLQKTRDLNLWSKMGDDKVLERIDDIFWNFLKNRLKVLDGKILISPTQWEKANELVHTLKTSKYTKEIFEDTDAINQFSYKFKINGVLYKIRIDKLRVDYNNKILYPYDLKTGHEVALAFPKNFYTNAYYLQGSLYYLGLQHLVEKHLPDFVVDNFRFIYISTKENPVYPIIYSFNKEWVKLGYEGFESKTGKKYKGIEELTSEYIYYMKYKSKLPKEVIELDGELPLPLP